jgi:MinD-like ATPase involved in chromosome partitioning or flagellar assembly
VPAYAPAYQHPLAGPLPVATAPVGLHHHEEQSSGAGGLLRRIGRFAAEAAYIAGASGRMQRDVENIATIRRPIGIGRMVGVIGPVPQSGTSIVAALLADTLAAQRSDEVLAVDADPHQGRLSRRLELAVRGTTRPRIRLARAEPTEDGIRAVLSGHNVGGANQIPVSLVDCPAGLYHAATAYVASVAHALALTLPSARDSAAYSVQLLDQLTPDGQQILVRKGVVVIAEVLPDDPEPVRWLQSAVSDRGLTYVVLPYDDHLAHAWPLYPDRLEPATRRAVLELTARLVERATR